MAMLPTTVDPNEVPPAAEMGPLPEGEYLAEIVDSEMRQAKSGGSMLQLTYRVCDGEEHAGRYVWHRLNLVNANEVAVRIAMQQLSAICHACGYLEPVTDSEQLHLRPHIIKVAFIPPRGEYKAQNEIKAWKAPGGPSSPAPAQPAGKPAPQETAAAPKSSGNRPPWAQHG